MPAASVPPITARLVNMLIEPFALLRCFSFNNSGIMPYLAGPKNALCVARRTMTTRQAQRLPVKNAPRARAAMPTSAIFASTVMRFLLMRSAICPAIPENKIKGIVRQSAT